MPASGKDVPKINSAELKELTEKLMTACHILDHEGVTDGYGHISVRVPGANAFITIANVSPGCVTRDRLIMQDLDGNYLDGAKTPPNSTGVTVALWIVPVVFVLGIVAAVALPAYQQYQQRAGTAQTR